MMLTKTCKKLYHWLCQNHFNTGRRKNSKKYIRKFEPYHKSRDYSYVKFEYLPECEKQQKPDNGGHAIFPAWKQANFSEVRKTNFSEVPS